MHLFLQPYTQEPQNQIPTPNVPREATIEAFLISNCVSRELTYSLLIRKSEKQYKIFQEISRNTWGKKKRYETSAHQLRNGWVDSMLWNIVMQLL